jgi:hypothetical protein
MDFAAFSHFSVRRTLRSACGALLIRVHDLKDVSGSRIGEQHFVQHRVRDT